MEYLKILVLFIFTACATCHLSSCSDDKSSTSSTSSTIKFNNINYSLNTLSDLNRPFAITTDASDNIYVAEFDLQKVLKFDTNLNFIGWIGADTSCNLVENWNTSYSTSQLSPPSNCRIFKGAHDVDFDSSGNLYVTEFYSGEISKFDNSGTYLGSLGVLSNGSLSGAFDQQTKITPTAESQFLYFPKQTTLDDSNNLYITVSNAVLKFNNSGTFIGWIGANSSATPTNGWQTTDSPAENSVLGGFSNTHAITFDNNSNLVIGDTNNHRLQRFTSAGVFIDWFGTQSNVTQWYTSGSSVESTSFAKPIAADLLSSGSLIVSSFTNQTIQAISDSEDIQDTLAGYPRAYGIHVKGNKIYIINQNQRLIYILQEL